MLVSGFLVDYIVVVIPVNNQAKTKTSTWNLEDILHTNFLLKYARRRNFSDPGQKNLVLRHILRCASEKYLRNFKLVRIKEHD